MSPLKTIREVDVRRMIRIAFLTGLGAVLANAVALLIFVSRLDSLREADQIVSTQARAEMCVATVESFHLYTESLIAIFDVAVERSPEGQAKFEALADSFRQDLAQVLPDCEALPTPN